jgi:hypothetical protein
MAKDDEVSRHRRIRSWFLEVVSFPDGFAERGFGKVDMVHVSACGSLG